MKVIKWLNLSILLHQKGLKGLVLLAMFSIAYSVGVATFSMVNFFVFIWFDANVIVFFLIESKRCKISVFFFKRSCSTIVGGY
jgi:hypothetical protein